MYSDVTKHVLEKFKESPILFNPFPHIEISNLFPDEFYKQILENSIEDDCLYTLTELKRVRSTYPQSRKILKLTKNLPILSSPKREFWQNLYKWLATDFTDVVIAKFKTILEEKYNGIPEFHTDVLYVRDTNSYVLGPHTDSERKLMTLLIYLPKNNELENLGTSIYVPLEPGFTCPGGNEYKTENFQLVKTAKFVPNELFGFIKTNNSFHGVEQIQQEIKRELLIYDLQRK